MFCVCGDLVNGFEGLLIGERLDFEWLKGGGRIELKFFFPAFLGLRDCLVFC